MCDNEKLLVKLYQLNNEKTWIDRGTGYLFFYVFENADETPASYRFLIAEDAEAERVMHEFELDPENKYELQQETLIAWVDADSEYAISFQTAQACQITFDTILSSIRALTGEESPCLSADSRTSEHAHNNDRNYPELNLGSLGEIARIFNELGTCNINRDQLSAIVDDLNFFRKLVSIFHVLEAQARDHNSIYINISNLINNNVNNDKIVNNTNINENLNNNVNNDIIESKIDENINLNSNNDKIECKIIDNTKNTDNFNNISCCNYVDKIIHDISNDNLNDKLINENCDNINNVNKGEIDLNNNNEILNSNIEQNNINVKIDSEINNDKISEIKISNISLNLNNQISANNSTDINNLNNISNDKSNDNFDITKSTSMEISKITDKIDDKSNENIELNKIDIKESLAHIYTIIKGMLTHMKFNTYEALITDDNIIEVIGMLEYNPALKTRIKHREILERSKMREIIPFTNSELKRLIINTHRLQYLQEILAPMPIALEERASYLVSILYFRKSEIVDAILDDNNFVLNLFKKLNKACVDADEVELILKMLSELCSMSKILQMDQKKNYLSKLLSYEIIALCDKFLDPNFNQFYFTSLNNIDNNDDKLINSIKFKKNIYIYIIDILFRICETFPEKLRDEVYAPSRADGSFFRFICDRIHSFPASNTSQQAVHIILMLLDSGTISNNITEPFSDFLTHFYDNSVDYLFKPIIDYTLSSPLSENNFSKALVVENLLDICAVCFNGHNSHIENYLMKNNFLLNIVNLLNSKYNFLVHSCIKIMRHSLGIVDKNFRTFLSKEKILDHFLDALLYKHTDYTLVNSALIELFEYLKISGNKQIAADLVERRKVDLEKITYVPTFKKLITFGEQFNKIKASKLKSSFLIRANELFKNLNRNALSEDERENLWFTNDDNEENRPKSEHDDVDINLPSIKSKSDSSDDHITLRPRVLRNMIKFSLKRPTSEKIDNEVSKTNHTEEVGQKSPLVDYSDDDEQEDNQTPVDAYKSKDEIVPELPSTKKSKLV